MAEKERPSTEDTTTKDVLRIKLVQVDGAHKVFSERVSRPHSRGSCSSRAPPGTPLSVCPSHYY